MLDIFAPFLSKALRDAQVHDPAVASVQRWVAALVGNANRFYAVMKSGIRCDCGEPAIAACVACHRTTCLGHAYVSSSARVLCDACAEGKAPHVAAQPKQADESKLRRAHLKTLGLSDPFTEAQLNAAFRKMAAKHHPDRQRDEAKKAVAQKHFVTVQQAYEWLKVRAPKEAPRAQV